MLGKSLPKIYQIILQIVFILVLEQSQNMYNINFLEHIFHKQNHLSTQTTYFHNLLLLVI